MTIVNTANLLSHVLQSVPGITNVYEYVPADISGAYPCLVLLPHTGVITPMTMGAQSYRHEYDIYVHAYILPVVDFPTGDTEARVYLDRIIETVRAHPDLDGGNVHAWVREWTYTANMMHGDTRYWGAQFTVRVLEVIA